MNNKNDPWSKHTLLAQLQEHHESFKAEIASLNQETYEVSWQEKWTAGQQLRHIVLSVKPVVVALSMPRFIVQWKFGLANRPSRSYEGLVQKYLNALSALEGMTAVAPKSFQPNAENFQNRAQLFLDYDTVLKKLLSQVEKISDRDLERFVLPHPLIGKLTFREMLYFTSYHVQHHHKIVKEIIRHTSASCG